MSRINFAMGPSADCSILLDPRADGPLVGYCWTSDPYLFRIFILGCSDGADRRVGVVLQSVLRAVLAGAWERLWPKTDVSESDCSNQRIARGSAEDAPRRTR